MIKKEEAREGKKDGRDICFKHLIQFYSPGYVFCAFGISINSSLPIMNVIVWLFQEVENVNLQ